MKKLIGAAILGTAIGAVPAVAQPAGPGPGEGRGRGNRGQAVIEYLGLSAEQQQQWRALHEQHREEMKTLFEEGRALRRKVQESLEADEPELLVGEAVKAAHAHRQQVQKKREAFRDGLKSLLSEEQKEKFEAFQAARQAGGKGRAGRGHRRGGRPGRGFGPPPSVEG
jgi:Spy/CpxP family protein refolding chaperone